MSRRQGTKAMVILSALLATSACTHQTKKVAAPPTSPSKQATATQAQTTSTQATEAAPTYDGPLRLHEVRLIEAAGQHSILFRLSRPPEGIDYFPLRNPSRLVIDIKGDIAPLQQVQQYKAADSLIAAVRIGNTQGRMRLVVDLKHGDPPSFSVDNYNNLVTAFIGEKNEKTNASTPTESDAQVLFLSEEFKNAQKTQFASLTQPQTDTEATEKTSETATLAAADQLSTAPDEKTENSGETAFSQIDKESEHGGENKVEEEILAAAPSPTHYEANLTETSLSAEDEPWDVERISEAPNRKARRTGNRSGDEALLLARGENAAPEAEFRSDLAQQYSGKKISLDFKNADVHDVLRIVAEVSGLNIVATDDVKARVTLRLVEVPWDQALDVVLQSNGLEKSRTGNVITVSTTKRLEAERNARLAAQNAQQKLTPLATDYVKVNYVKATEVAALVSRESVQRASSATGRASGPARSAPAGGASAGGRGGSSQVALMSPRGTIAADATTNVVIIRDLPENILAIRELIKNVDIQTPQVVIESQIVTANENALRDLGIQWGYSYKASPETGNSTGVNFPGRLGIGGIPGLAAGLAPGAIPFIADFPASLAPGSASALDLTLGSLNGSQSLNMRISAIERQGNARVISRPRVVTLNNKTADIRSRREVRVPITAGSLSVAGSGGASGGGNAFEKFDVGITLKVTPQISSDGFILLDLDVESSELAAESSAPPSGSSATPIIKDVLLRRANSNVLIRAGDTFVLGGIVEDQLIRSERGIPYLRDTPGLSWLFGGRSNNRNKQELLVFLTPKLVAGVATAGLPSAQQLWETRPKEDASQMADQQP